MPDEEARRTDVSVILVSYNTARLLVECLDRVLRAIGSLSVQVIVIDNASRDESLNILQRHYPQFEIIENVGNVGFGRANNQALARARGRYLLLLNVDAYVEPDALRKTVAYMDAAPRTGVLGVRLVGRDGSLQPSCRYFPTPWNTFLQRSGLHRLLPYVRLVDDMSWPHDETRRCDWVPGCYYLVRREVVDRVGLFDPRFFLYYEEVDHCRAVRAAGWDVIFFPHTTVVHLGGESAAVEAEILDVGRQIPSLQAESEFLYFRKHHGAAGVWTALVLGWLAEALTGLRRALRHGRAFDLVRAWRNACATASIFRNTRAGRQPTR